MRQIERLRELPICTPGLEWVFSQGDPDEQWMKYDRGDYMMWFLGSMVAGDPWSEYRKVLVRIIAECFGKVMHLFPPAESRPKRLEIDLRNWADGEESIAEVEASGAAERRYAGELAKVAKITGVESAEFKAAAGGMYASFAPVCAYDVGGTMDRAVGCMADAVVDINRVACEAIRRVFPKPPKALLRKYVVTCTFPRCWFRCEEIVSDRFRNGPEAARLSAFTKHGFFHGTSVKYIEITESEVWHE